MLLDILTFLLSLSSPEIRKSPSQKRNRTSKLQNQNNPNHHNHPQKTTRKPFSLQPSSFYRPFPPPPPFGGHPWPSTLPTPQTVWGGHRSPETGHHHLRGLVAGEPSDLPAAAHRQTRPGDADDLHDQSLGAREWWVGKDFLMRLRYHGIVV